MHFQFTKNILNCTHTLNSNSDYHKRFKKQWHDLRTAFRFIDFQYGNILNLSQMNWTLPELYVDRYWFLRLSQWKLRQQILYINIFLVEYTHSFGSVCLFIFDWVHIATAKSKSLLFHFDRGKHTVCLSPIGNYHLRSVHNLSKIQFNEKQYLRIETTTDSIIQKRYTEHLLVKIGTLSVAWISLCVTVACLRYTKTLNTIAP